MDKRCAIRSCKSQRQKAKYCLKHYTEIKLEGGTYGENGQFYKRDLNCNTCSIEHCTKLEYVQGLCTTHYKRKWRHDDPTKLVTVFAYGNLQCKVEGCEDLAKVKEMCQRHAERFKNYGRTHRILPAKGKGKGLTAGYITVWNEFDRLEYEHRMIARRALGKPLPKGCIVHHVNGVKTDNRPENLLLLPSQHYHMCLHVKQSEIGLDESQLKSWENLLDAEFLRHISGNFEFKWGSHTGKTMGKMKRNEDS